MSVHDDVKRCVVPNRFGVPCIKGGVPGGGGGAVNEYLVIEGDGSVAGLADSELFHVDALYRIAEALTVDGGAAIHI